jgi:hypothetical protein
MMLQHYALVGKQIVDHRAATILQLDGPVNSSETYGYRWALLHQATSVLLDREIWETGGAHSIQEMVRSIWSANPIEESSGETKKIFADNNAKAFRSVDCLQITHADYESPGFFTGFASEVSDQRATLDQGLRQIDGIAQLSWLTKMMGAIVYTAYGTQDRHVSSTQRDLPGTIITDHFLDSYHCAETLVHEASHTAFNLALEGTGSMHAVLYAECDYYSPWKQAIRPAYGLLHAVVAFSHVEQLRIAVGRGSSDGIELLRRAQPVASSCLHEIGYDPLTELVLDILTETLAIAKCA